MHFGCVKFLAEKFGRVNFLTNLKFVLCLLNVALPTFDVYSDLVVSINFFIGSRSNPACDELFDNITDRIKCYYNDTISTLDVTYTPHVTWGTIMLVPVRSTTSSAGTSGRPRKKRKLSPGSPRFSASNLNMLLARSFG